MHKNGTTNVGQKAHIVDEKIDALSDTLKNFVDQSTQKVDAIKAKVIEAKNRTMLRGSDMLERVTDLIKEHPLKAVGIAFGAGYIGMRLFRR